MLSFEFYSFVDFGLYDVYVNYKWISKSTNNEFQMSGEAMLTQRDLKVAEGLIQGKPYSDIAKDIGAKSKSTVHDIAHRDEVRQVVEKAYNILATKCILTSAENFQHVIENYQKPTRRVKLTKTIGKGKGAVTEVKEYDEFDEQLRDHGFKASQRVLESAQLLPSHATSVVHNTIINQETNVINPVIQALIQKHFGGMLKEPEVIDADCNEDSTEC